jgi:hypothetical protein
MTKYVVKLHLSARIRHVLQTESDEGRLVTCTREGLFKQISSACLQRNYSTVTKRINRGVFISDQCNCIDIVYFEATADALLVIIGKLKCIPSVLKSVHIRDGDLGEVEMA